MDRGNLVLSLRVGEPLYIGEEITITLLSRQGNQARISIEAPKSIAIVRDGAVKKEPRSIG